MNTEKTFDSIQNKPFPEQESEFAVEINHLQKSFRNKTILSDISLKLQKAENLVILGKSGTGKSVLIKCLAGLIPPEDGEIIVLGKNIQTIPGNELNELRKKIGFLFQSAALYDSMTVRQNIEFPLRSNKTITRDEIDQRVLKVLTNVGLPEAMDLMPSELSGGMRKRVGLARTLVLNPAIMLYDEPTTGLDPITSKEISQLILDMQKEYNTSSIIITHDIDCAKITSNRIKIIKDGTFYSEGSFAELSGSNDKWVSAFFN